jgi:ferredoxin-NADP reductase
MAERARECRARVVALRPLTRQILEADLRMEDPPALQFDAGQWVSVPFGPKLVRAYSIVSTPQSPARLTLCADVAPAGIGSRWFRALAPGQEVAFKGPLGGFVFPRADPRRPLFVAEEIGIVPIRSILMELYATGFGRPARLVHWARDPSWLVYEGDFRSLARRYPGFAYHPVVGQAPADWAGKRGAVDDIVERLTPTVDGLVAYVCGGGTTVDRVRAALVGRGLERKAVKWEKFW